MKGRWLGIAVVTVLIGLGGLSWFIPAGEESTQRVVATGLGSVKTLQAAYDRWKGALPEDTSRKFSLSLGYIRGLSDEVTKARGKAELDLINGSLSVKVYGLPETAHYDVWLVDNLPGPNRSVKPEAGDTMINIGSLHSSDSLATLETSLDPDILSDFKLDLVVVSRMGETPGEGGLLFGAPGVFQRLYYNEQVGEGMTLANTEPSGNTGDATGSFWSAPFRALVPAPAYAKKPGSPPGLQNLMEQGEILFTQETFDGNGRTCASCHRPEDNFTIGPAFIATLPDDDPLFVAEFNGALGALEIPALMREFGLILENVDTFGEDGVMRGIPHTLAMMTSLTPSGDVAAAGRGHAIGWSGDGALNFADDVVPPGSDITAGLSTAFSPGLNGTLLSFAIGAVVQHFPRTLARDPDADPADFRFPTDQELVDMEAFQMSLGREADIDIDPNDGDGAIELTGTLASQGQILFLDAAEEDIRCHSCHKNAGANANFDFPPGTLDTNANFNTGVERLPDPAYRMVASDIPCDAGFGNGVDIGLTGPCADVVTTGNSRAFGDGTFNTPPLIEAADTAPFFHNHSVNTIEGAVAFYNSDTFNNSPAAAFGRNISLTIPQVDAIAAFLRVLNALENIRNSLLIETNALAGINAVPKAYDVDNLVHVAYAEVEDAIQVLEGAQLHGEAVVTLKAALQLLDDCLNTPSYPTKADLLEQVMTLQLQARSQLCVLGSDDVLCEDPDEEA